MSCFSIKMRIVNFVACCRGRCSAFILLSSLLLSACDAGKDERAEQAPPPARPAGDVTHERLFNADDEPGEWFTGGRDWRQSYYSPLTKINKQNVTELGFAWSSDLLYIPSPGFEATPIVVDGHMFTSGLSGEVYALDARTGKQLWSFKPEMSPFVVGFNVNRGVAVWKGKVYVAARDARLYALDAATGEVLWDTDTVIDHSRAYSSSGAPYIAGKYVLIGNSGAERDVRGYVSAYDLETGELGWRFFTVPGDPKNGFEHPELEMAAKTWDPDSLWDIGLGGTAWDGMAYDPELNLVYVGTGNGLPWAHSIRSPKGGDNLFLSSILAIDADTGILKWHYQTTPGDSWDSTATSKMILADLMIDGRLRKTVMQAPKNSFFYVLDRETGELLSADPYIYRNWASHVDMKTGRPVATAQSDYTDGPKLLFPTHGGSRSWQPMSYNPGTGLVYLPAVRSGVIFGLSAEPFQPKIGTNNAGLGITVVTMREGSILSPTNWPSLDKLKAGWPDPTTSAFLIAWDPVRQKEVWKVELTGKEYPYPSGVMSSASGLVFQGNWDGYLNVFDALSSERLHSMHVGGSIIAAPMTYRIGDEQFVAVMAGTVDEGQRGRIIAFKLGGGEVPQLPPIPKSLKPPVENVTDMVEVRRGGQLFRKNCAGCHMTDRAPNLARSMSAKDHNEFLDIVRNGLRAQQGMPSFSGLISEEDAKAIHTYVIYNIWGNYQRQIKKDAGGDLEQKEASPH